MWCVQFHRSMAGGGRKRRLQGAAARPLGFSRWCVGAEQVRRAAVRSDGDAGRDGARDGEETASNGKGCVDVGWEGGQRGNQQHRRTASGVGEKKEGAAIVGGAAVVTGGCRKVQVGGG